MTIQTNRNPNQLIASINPIDGSHYRVMSADGHGGCIIRRNLDDAINAVFSHIDLGNEVAIFAPDGSPVQAYEREFGVWMPMRCVAQ